VSKRRSALSLAQADAAACRQLVVALAEADEAMRHHDGAMAGAEWDAKVEAFRAAYNRLLKAATTYRKPMETTGA
jgi:hypothetical protein